MAEKNPVVSEVGQGDGGQATSDLHATLVKSGLTERDERGHYRVPYPVQRGGLDSKDDGWLRDVWRAVGGGTELTGPLLRFADAVHRRALSPSAREATTDASVSVPPEGKQKDTSVDDTR